MNCSKLKSDLSYLEDRFNSINTSLSSSIDLISKLNYENSINNEKKLIMQFTGLTLCLAEIKNEIEICKSRLDKKEDCDTSEELNSFDLNFASALIEDIELKLVGINTVYSFMLLPELNILTKGVLNARGK